MIRLGVVGCGSVVQQYHLPALAELPVFSVVGLADTNRAILKQIQSRWSVPQAESDYRKLRDLDAVLIASPHSLHAAMCDYFLRQDVHVLVEKPMVIREKEAEELVTLANARRKVFAVGVFRRYYPSSLLIRSMIQQNWLGGVVKIDAEEGSPYDWELKSRFLLDRRLAGGGVLIDTGSHLLDRLLWWFPNARVHLESYADDSARGVEADCEIHLRMYCDTQEIPCHVVLSRTRQLRNTIRLRLRQGWIEIGSNIPNGFCWESSDLTSEESSLSPLWLQCGLPSDAPILPQDYFRKQLADFARAIETRDPPLNDAVSNLPAVRLIEQCYVCRKPLPEPWNENAAVPYLQPGGIT
jgi:predicted dehydrogenase